MKIARTINEAYEMAYEMIGAYQKDERGTKNAGYNIYRSEENYYDYICDLGNRLEVNTHDGKSLNIWIETEEQENQRELETKVKEQEYEILKLKAKLYDLLCK